MICSRSGKLVFSTFTFLLLISFYSSAIAENPDSFILWATSDNHGETAWDDDVSLSGGVWSGDMIDEVIPRIDYGIIAGDIVHPQPCSEAQVCTYINNTCSCIVDGDMQTYFWDLPADERIWGFCMGNHEGEAGENLTKYAKAFGLDSTRSWYNNSVTMGHAYNYTIQKGNLLIIFMGGDRDYPTAYNYSLNTPADLEWFNDTVNYADDNHMNVVVVTHYCIFNGSSRVGSGTASFHTVFYNVTSEQWEECTTHTDYAIGFKDPWFGGDGYEDTDPWNASDSYWEIINRTGNINLWLSGHTHTEPNENEPPPHEHAGWDTTLGVERDVQKGIDCTFVNLGAAGAYDVSWEYSRVIKFTNGSRDFLVKSFDHDEDSYGDDTGWQSSHQNITITNGLKYPYDPNWVVDRVYISSIEGNTYSWEINNNALSYQLQVANDTGFTDTFVNLSNLYEGCPLEDLPGCSYSENSTHVTFTLPYSYNNSYLSTQYCRVRCFKRGD